MVCLKCGNKTMTLTGSFCRAEKGMIYIYGCSTCGSVQNVDGATHCSVFLDGDTISTGYDHYATPISDANNLSVKSNGTGDFETWAYKLALLLDKQVPVQGYTNAQRIEIAIRRFLSSC